MLKEERRRFNRIKIVKDIGFDLVLDNKLIAVHIMDISRGGARLKCDKLFKVGTEAELKISENDSIAGKIKWVQKAYAEDRYEAGIEFEREWDENIDNLKGGKYIIKRRFERKAPPKKINIEIWNPRQSDKLREIVLLVDLSLAGVRIKSGRVFEYGELVHMQLPDNRVVEGNVRWCSSISNKINEGYFVGIEFVKGSTVYNDNEEIRGFKEKILNEPWHVEHYNKLGILYRRNNRLLEALDNYKRAIRIDSDNEVLYFNISRVYIDMGDLGSARETLGYALKLKPDFSEATALLNEIKEIE